MSSAQGLAPDASGSGRVLSPLFASRILLILGRPFTFWCLLTFLCLVRSYVGLYGTRNFSHDGFMVLDGAWRMLNGQRPHVDFNSMVGPVAYLPTLVGLSLTGDSVSGFGYGQAIAGFLLATWAFWLSTGLSAPARTCYALCTAAVTLSPAIIGPSPLDIGPAMTYNRLSYALLSLLLLDVLTESRSHAARRGLSSGVILGLLAFLKVTAFGAGILILAFFAVLNRRPRQGWLMLLAGWAATCFTVLLYLHFHVLLIVRDLAITVAAKHINFDTVYLYSAILFEAGIALAFTLGLAAWLRQTGAPEAGRRAQWSGLFLIVLSFLLLFGNFQHSELPLMGFFAIIAIDHAYRNSAAAATSAHLGTMRMGFCFVGLTLAAVLVALAVGVRARLYTVRYAPRFDSPALEAFVPVAGEYSYVQFVNDGLHLLEQHRRPGERVMSLDFTNPFSFGLHLPPAPGGTTNLQYRGSFDGHHFVPAAQLFGASELVISPLNPSDYSLVGTVQDVYGAYLNTHYTLAGQSKEWRLYRRNPTPTPTLHALTTLPK